MDLDVKHTQHNRMVSVLLTYWYKVCTEHKTTKNSATKIHIHTQLSCYYHVSHHQADKKIFTL
jgi:hypothetical protein